MKRVGYADAPNKNRAANASSLQKWKRIPKQNLSLTDNEELYVYGMYAASEDDLLLACGAAGLRALSLKTGELEALEDPIAS